MDRKLFCYFFIATVSSFFQADTPPATLWAWSKLLGISLVQGVVAIKALQSMPDDKDKPIKTEVVNTVDKPVETHES